MNENTILKENAIELICLEFQKFQEKLFKFPKEIKYEIDKNQNWIDEKKIIDQIVDIKGNVYCLFVKEKNSEKINPLYVGQRESKSIKQRLKEHLFYKNEQTGSKLQEIKDVVRNGGQIYINTVFIEPEFLRHSLEKMIIEKNQDVLKWNIHIS